MESHFPIPSTHQTQLARERVMDDLHALVIDAELLLKATAGDLGAKAAEARQRLTANVDRAKQTLANWGDRGLESAQALALKADVAVRENPYRAAAVALGAGIVVGFVLGHRWRQGDGQTGLD